MSQNINFVRVVLWLLAYGSSSVVQALHNFSFHMWLFVLCLWSHQSEFKVLCYDFNLWSVPGFIFFSESCA